MGATGKEGKVETVGPHTLFHLCSATDGITPVLLSLLQLQRPRERRCLFVGPAMLLSSSDSEDVSLVSQWPAGGHSLFAPKPFTKFLKPSHMPWFSCYGT